MKRKICYYDIIAFTNGLFVIRDVLKCMFWKKVTEKNLNK